CGNSGGAYGGEFPTELRDAALQLRLTNDPRFYDDVRKRIEALAPLVPGLASRLVSSRWLSTLDGEQLAIGAHGHEHQRFSMMPVARQHIAIIEHVRLLFPCTS